MIFCANCGDPIEVTPIVHHTSYFPERTVIVHPSCHAVIHHSKVHDLKPPEGQAEVFYGGRTQIQVEDETTERLKKNGIKGETYDDIINRVLEFYEKVGGKMRA